LGRDKEMMGYVGIGSLGIRGVLERDKDTIKCRDKVMGWISGFVMDERDHTRY
jgi:hypothetical protein